MPCNYVPKTFTYLEITKKKGGDTTENIANLSIHKKKKRNKAWANIRLCDPRT